MKTLALLAFISPALAFASSPTAVKRVPSSAPVTLAQAAQQVHASSAGKLIAVGGTGIYLADGATPISLSLSTDGLPILAVSNAVCNFGAHYQVAGDAIWCIAK